MRLLIRISINALILWILAELLAYDPTSTNGILVIGGWMTYLIGGGILAILNATLRPILSVVGIPLQIFTFGAFTFVINAIVLFALTWLILKLRISGVTYEINGAIEFLISVAIFTILNTLLGVFRS